MHYASSYSKHLATHSSDRPYKCDVCDSTFKDKGYLRKHIITHSGFKKYRCDKCDKRFAHRGNLSVLVYCIPTAYIRGVASTFKRGEGGGEKKKKKEVCESVN